MNGKHVFSLILLGLLVVAFFDLTEACKKCGIANCNCIPRIGYGQGHAVGFGHGLGHGYGQHVAPISYAPICKSTYYQPPHHHIGYGASYGGIGCGCGHAGGYGGHHQYYSSPPPVCNACGGYSYAGGHSFYSRKPWYRPRCRCY